MNNLSEIPFHALKMPVYTPRSFHEKGISNIASVPFIKCICFNKLYICTMLSFAVCRVHWNVIEFASGRRW
jgi:hypothetical protein